MDNLKSKSQFFFKSRITTAISIIVISMLIMVIALLGCRDTAVRTETSQTQGKIFHIEIGVSVDDDFETIKAEANQLFIDSKASGYFDYDLYVQLMNSRFDHIQVTHCNTIDEVELRLVNVRQDLGGTTIRKCCTNSSCNKGEPKDIQKCCGDGATRCYYFAETIAPPENRSL